MSVPLYREINESDIATAAYFLYLKNIKYDDLVKRYAELLSIFELNLRYFSLSDLRKINTKEQLNGFQGKFSLPTMKDKLSKEHRILHDYQLTYDKLHYYIAELELILDRICQIFAEPNQTQPCNL